MGMVLPAPLFRHSKSKMGARGVAQRRNSGGAKLRQVQIGNCIREHRSGDKEYGDPLGPVDR
jgi:hypothetical protein